MSGPCFSCPDRHEKCHAKCEKYIAYRKEVDKANERKAHDLDALSYQRDVRERIMKRRKHDREIYH